MSPSDQPPPDGFSAVEWVLIVITSAVLALLIFTMMVIVVLLSVPAFLLALPFFLLDERRHRRTIGHPLWDSCLDFRPELGVGEKAGPNGLGRVGST